MNAIVLHPDENRYNNRYEIKKQLSQGGFGRTYLAFDRTKDELCVLKEFAFTSANPDKVQKARSLFEREAETLRQLDHKQIPKLIEKFEDFGRLFLVQQFVNGKTYQQLLQERVQAKQTFTEDEVIQWLLDLLPVLDYIHDRGIIHRDITPHNIMLPNGSHQLPVLIDFGASKQEITRLNSNLEQGTTIGKPGYSPQEQIQFGECYYSSDIYSLGVTAVVLLTGLEPSCLFDSESLTWQWKKYISVGKQFAGILYKMLAQTPQNRYQSAREVLEALSSPPDTDIIAPPPPPPPPPPPRNPVVEIAIALAVPTLTVTLALGILFGVSPHIDSLCHQLTNCAPEIKEREFAERYSAAIEQWTVVSKFARAAENVQELKNSRDRMNNVIAQLVNISSSASIYPQVQQALLSYRNELAQLDKRLDDENKASELWEATLAIAQSADKTTSLEEARTLWNKAIENLEAVPPTSFLAKDALGQLQVYKIKVEDIDKQLSAIAQRQHEAAQLQTPEVVPSPNPPTIIIDPLPPSQPPLKECHFGKKCQQPSPIFSPVKREAAKPQTPEVPSPNLDNPISPSSPSQPSEKECLFSKKCQQPSAFAKRAPSAIAQRQREAAKPQTPEVPSPNLDNPISPSSPSQLSEKECLFSKKC